MRRSAQMEVEFLNYCISMRKLNALYRHRVTLPDEIEDTKAELEAMAMHTEWPLLRLRCVEAIDEAGLAVDVA